MDMSPSQWSQKLNEKNNTSVNLNDAERFTELFGDTRWITYLVWKHIIKAKRSKDELIKMREQIERQLQEWESK